MCWIQKTAKKLLLDSGFVIFPGFNNEGTFWLELREKGKMKKKGVCFGYRGVHASKY
jgi:hypothetical protein